MSGNEAAGDRLYQDPELVQFYDLENEWDSDLEFCFRFAKEALSVLDLGCGTGRLAASLADGRSVVGVDPAAAMLDVARGRPGGKGVTWVHSDARSVRLGRNFDLVLLTGHAFQVFLTDDDQEAVLATIAEHLAPDGRFIFDTRNPAVQEWREWGQEYSRRAIEHPELGMIEAWNESDHDAATGIVTYRTHYRVEGSGKRFSASSKIRFTPREPLAAMMTRAGLAAEEWLGDWSGGACDPTSPEIIPIGRLG